MDGRLWEKGVNNLYGPGDDFDNELCFLSEPDKAVNRFYNLLLKGGWRKKEKKKVSSKIERGVRWILHLDTGLIQFEHIQAENEIISRLVHW